jgi:hypothetical protein
MDEDDAAGFGDGIAVEVQAADVHEVVRHLVGSVGGKGFAINQSVAQVSRKVWAKEGCPRFPVVQCP